MDAAKLREQAKKYLAVSAKIADPALKSKVVELAGELDKCADHAEMKGVGAGAFNWQTLLQILGEILQIIGPYLGPTPTPAPPVVS